MLSQQSVTVKVAFMERNKHKMKSLPNERKKEKFLKYDRSDKSRN
jgi:hypothetical protein